MSVTYQSEFMRRLAERGFIHQCSDLDALDGVASDGVLTAYIGFDCTAKSLHVGNLLSIMMLRHLQQAGGRPIVVLGGGTTKIGDPSGREEGRTLLTPEQITANRESLKRVFAQFLTFGDGATDALMVDNDDWLAGLNYIDFLRDYGRHFSVNKMLRFDSVKTRLEREQALSFIEFNYMVLQAYDFLELNRRYDCRLQMGGSDQWGNIVNGIELTRRVDGAQIFGLTTELLTTASGAKMGKTAQGAVWLNDDMRSAYDYWQFWRDCEDGDVARFLRLFTELPLDEVARLEALQGAELNDAKKTLATEATALAHGRAAAEQAERTAQAVFESGGASDDLPTIFMTGDGIGVLDALREAGLTASNSEGRRYVAGGGVQANNAPISDPKTHLGLDDMKDGVIKLSLGKKRHALIKIREGQEG